MRKTRDRIIAFVAGILFGPAIVFAGLETAVYISDLVATNPLSSDLASTADDHIRLLKSTIKTTFPNINNAVTATDEQLNATITNIAANPTGTIGLSTVNGSASTYLRSDGAPPLSQAIAPTWSAQHIFSSAYAGAGSSANLLSSNLPMTEWNDANSDTDDKLWQMFANSDQFILRAITDDRTTASGTVFQVDRTNGAVDRVHFPSESANNAFVVGTVTGTALALANIRSTGGGGRGGLIVTSASTSGIVPLYVHNEATSGNNVFVSFRSDANTERGTIDFDRTGVVTRYNTTSDVRLKKNFKAAPSARKVIDCIQVESYDWKKTGSHVDHGLVAQRLAKCAPYAVSQGDVWQISKAELVPVLIKYVQEQDARIAELERRLH
jgi:hypothetical protein